MIGIRSLVRCHTSFVLVVLVFAVTSPAQEIGQWTARPADWKGATTADGKVTIDPGPQNDLETYHGQRVWFGRHVDQMHVAPAIEYDIKADWNRDPKDAAKIMPRKLNTAVCAAFYDTGVSFESETGVPGTKLRVQYRYTGYPAAEAESLFQQSKIYDSPTLDPQHHYIFADEWPKLTFRQFVPLSQTWIYGRTPFMTAHNTRPTYELEKNCGAGSGFAMKLAPNALGNPQRTRKTSRPERLSSSLADSKPARLTTTASSSHMTKAKAGTMKLAASKRSDPSINPAGW